jgi:hypothetical protein
MPCRGFITVPLGAPATLSGTVRERMERAGWLLLGQGRHLCPAHRRLWRQEQFELHGHILMAVDEFGDGGRRGGRALGLLVPGPGGLPGVPAGDGVR